MSHNQVKIFITKKLQQQGSQKEWQDDGRLSQEQMAMGGPG